MCYKVTSMNWKQHYLAWSYKLFVEKVFGQNSSNKGLTKFVIRKSGRGHKLDVFYEQEEDKWEKNQSQQEGDW